MAEEQLAAGYDSVKLFIRWLEGTQTSPFLRMECAPGQE